MLVLITVGTTPFDSLIRALDKPYPNIDVIFQIGGGSYIPSSHVYYRFVENFESLLNDANFIITHAGAGSVFKILEMNKDALVVPNIDRNDSHQKELSSYLIDNYFLPVVDVNFLKETEWPEIISTISKYKRVKYNSDPFFKIDEIINFFKA